MNYVPSAPFVPSHLPVWGPSGETVYDRTYSRTKPDGTRENWAETVNRVVSGNMGLVPEKNIEPGEYAALCNLFYDFDAIPAGRHLWASGVAGRQYLFNCHVSGWTENLSDHFRFTFLRLMEGGGVGANYSTRFLKRYAAPSGPLSVHVVCDPSHPDYAAMKAAGVLSDAFSAEWAGAYEVGDSREGWADALCDLLDTYTRTEKPAHIDRVYDVTNVRASGSRLKTFGGFASGPEPFAKMLNSVGDTMNSACLIGVISPLDAMDIDHAIAECVVSGGNRRSARMSVVEWDDPSINAFLACKRDGSKHWTTNISVGIDDAFIAALDHWENVKGSGVMIPSPEDMVAKRANDIHRKVVDAMLANGEPGYWNRSLSQIGEVNEVVCTNPCGEIVLEPWENCNLGHVNLSHFVTATNRVAYDRMFEAHRLMTRMLIRATYGDVNDAKQAERLKANRRIGVGHFGVQGFLAKMGIRYSDAPKGARVPGGDSMMDILASMYEEVRETANLYAHELRIPAPIKVTTVAPTGSIAKLSGDQEGIHPVYGREFEQRIRFSITDPLQRAQLEAFEAKGFQTEKDKAAPNTWIVVIPTRESLVADVVSRGFPATVVQQADEISLDEMLAFQAMYQRHYADNAVSFTVNFPEGSLPAEYVRDTLRKWLPVLKGTTLMPDGTREQAPLTRITAAQYEAAIVKAVGDSIDEDCANGSCPVR